MIHRRVLSALLLSLALIACRSTTPNAKGINFLDQTDKRLRAPDTYFAKEYERINARRAHFGFDAASGKTRPPAVVGLALSGGGIRSNAFQLGILAGLHEEAFHDATLLDRVDYVSSVSGGTWANLAMWAWPRDLSEMFRCLDDAAVDKGSQRPGGIAASDGATGFFFPFAADAPEWVRSKFVRRLLPGGDTGFSDGSQLSMIAAHSSAVIQGAGGGLRAFFLDFYFRILEGTEQARDPKLRTHYVLADGGKSDNTGLVPLVDRGTDIVIASYMGKEKVEKPFGDLLMAREQVQQLFGCEISLEGVVTDPAHKLNQEGHHVCSAAPNSASKSMLHVHPW